MNRITRGFTLLELLVVLAIASLLAALVPPVFSAAMPVAKLGAATRDVVLILRESRHLAVSRGIDVDVGLDSEARRMTIGGQRIYRRQHEISADIDITVRESARDPAVQDFLLRFHPDGSSTGAVVRLSNGDAAFRVDVDWFFGAIEVSEVQVYEHE